MAREKNPNFKDQDSSAEHLYPQLEAEMLEDILLVQLLKEMRNRIPLDVGDTVFRLDPPFARQPLQVMKIQGDTAEVVPQSLWQRDKTVSLLAFKVNELWHEDDLDATYGLVKELSPEEMKDRIAGNYNLPESQMN